MCLSLIMCLAGFQIQEPLPITLYEICSYLLQKSRVTSWHIMGCRSLWNQIGIHVLIKQLVCSSLWDFQGYVFSPMYCSLYLFVPLLIHVLLILYVFEWLRRHIHSFFIKGTHQLSSTLMALSHCTLLISVHKWP